MKDLDFDELDQAVSSVLGSSAAEPKKEDAPVDAHVPAPVKPESTEAKATDKPEEKAEDKKDTEEKPATAAPAVSPAVRRRGQFLDMVHPSADMTSRLPITSPAARKQLVPISSDTDSLKPAASATPADVNKVESDSTSADVPAPVVSVPETTPMPEPETSEKPAAASSEEPAKADDVKWPDPLDLGPSTESESPAPVVAAEPTPEATDGEPATTPFVPDVKVDKRPLGSPVPAASEPAAELAKPDGADEDSKSPVITPPELQPEVVSVEAAADREFAPDGTDTETNDEANKGMAQSIPQQYHTPTEKPDIEAHPVFDTKEYHQPLLPAHSKKRSKGWLIVVIILALLVVGAGLGYVAFMSGL